MPSEISQVALEKSVIWKNKNKNKITLHESISISLEEATSFLCSKRK